MLRALIVVLALLCAPLPVIAAEPAASALMRQIGFDSLFRNFGTTLATSPRQHGIADERFLAAWEKTAGAAFGQDHLNTRLQQSLAASLSDVELSGIGNFLSSPLGVRLTTLEMATRRIAPERQIEALARGKTLYFVLSETRRSRFDEIIALSGSDMAFAMLGESLRGMALGLHLSRGDIDLDWEEIDTEVRTKLAGLKESLVDATRATLAFTYAELNDEELEAYLDFLRAPATRKFYTTLTTAVGAIIEQTMFDLGQDVAQRLNAVSI